MGDPISFLIIALVSACFAGYAFFDCLTVLIRTSAATQQMNAAGAAFEKIMATLKRLAMFTYPPLLGITILKHDGFTLFWGIQAAFMGGVFATAICTLFRSSLSVYCDRVIQAFRIGESALQALFSGLSKTPERSAVVFRGQGIVGQIASAISKDPTLFLTNAWVTLIYSSAIFFMNCLAFAYVESAAVLLQTLGLINGLGTLLLSFVVDPIISRYLDHRQQLDALALNLFASNMVVYAFVAPICFVAVGKLLNP